MLSTKISKKNFISAGNLAILLALGTGCWGYLTGTQGLEKITFKNQKINDLRIVLAQYVCMVRFF